MGIKKSKVVSGSGQAYDFYDSWLLTGSNAEECQADFSMILTQHAVQGGC
jgi:hypothetical protein